MWTAVLFVRHAYDAPSSMYPPPPSLSAPPSALAQTPTTSWTRRRARDEPTRPYVLSSQIVRPCSHTQHTHMPICACPAARQLAYIPPAPRRYNTHTYTRSERAHLLGGLQSFDHMTLPHTRAREARHERAQRSPCPPASASAPATPPPAMSMSYTRSHLQDSYMHSSLARAATRRRHVSAAHGFVRGTRSSVGASSGHHRSKPCRCAGVSPIATASVVGR